MKRIEKAKRYLLFERYTVPLLVFFKYFTLYISDIANKHYTFKYTSKSSISSIIKRVALNFVLLSLHIYISTFFFPPDLYRIHSIKINKLKNKCLNFDTESSTYTIKTCLFTHFMKLRFIIPIYNSATMICKYNLFTRTQFEFQNRGITTFNACSSTATASFGSNRLR